MGAMTMREVTTVEEEAMEGITIEMLEVLRKKRQNESQLVRLQIWLIYGCLAFNLLDHRPDGLLKLIAIQCARSCSSWSVDAARCISIFHKGNASSKAARQTCSDGTS